MCAALLLALIGFHPAPSGAASPHTPAASVIVPIGPVLVAIDSDSDLPSKEYGLLRGTQDGDENQEEDGDGDDAQSPRADWGFDASLFSRTARPSLSASILRALDLGSMPRLACLRC